MLFRVVISYNNVHEFTNNLLTLYEIKVLTRMKSELCTFYLQSKIKKIYFLYNLFIGFSIIKYSTMYYNTIQYTI